MDIYKQATDEIVYRRQQLPYSSREKMLAMLSEAESKTKTLTGEELEKHKEKLNTLYEVWNSCFSQ